MRVRLDLDTLSIITTEAVQNQTASWDGFLQGISQQNKAITDVIDEKHQQVDERISRIEHMLQAQSSQIKTNQSMQIGSLYNMSPPPSRRRHSRALSSSRLPQPYLPARTEAIGVRLNQYTTSCRPGCLCACHSQTRSTTPNFVNRVLGQLFVGYAGMPLLSAGCDLSTCEKSQVPHVSFEYWFPLGFFWSQIIRLQLAYQPNTGPQFSLDTLRRVPDSAQCVSYALEGNIEGLKSLFKHGLASPRDVSSTRGYSLLRVSKSVAKKGTCADLHSGLCMANSTKLASFYYQRLQIQHIGQSRAMTTAQVTKLVTLYFEEASLREQWRF